MLKSPIILINSLILMGSISVLIYNYSVIHQINVATDQVNIKVDHVNETYDKIQYYKEYEKALKISGFKHVELVKWLVEYGNGNFHKRIQAVNTVLEEESLLMGAVSLRGLQLLKKQEFEKLEDHLIKFIRKSNNENKYGTESSIKLKDKITKYFSEEGIEL